MSSQTQRASQTSANSLPLVVQVGFAAARELYDAKVHPAIDADQFELAAQEQLHEILKRELNSLDLGPQLFVCGISSLAIGADTIFTQVCKERGIMQRIFLPQPREDFLAAVGSAGPDFTEAQQETARELLTSEHIIEERVVSDAADRRERFHDVNLEIVRVSDLVVCLVRENQENKSGGSREVIELAAKRKRPVLEVQIAVKDGAPVLTPARHDWNAFERPKLPHDIESATLPAGAVREPQPTVDAYIRGLKDFASSHANWGRKRFVAAALAIIGAHVIATVLAVLALKLHGGVILPLLSAELALLAIGLGIHEYLHRTHRVQRWAMARLAAEVARSVGSIGRFHLYLEYLFILPFPTSLRPLLRTINVLHLYSTKDDRSAPWKGAGEAKRDEYVFRRLTSKKHKAQIPYNEDTRDKADRRLKIARWTFFAASLGAILATLIKLLSAFELFPMEHQTREGFQAVMGVLAVVLPVIAVAALSLASAFDLEARHTTSEEMIKFLNEQKLLLENASSNREYSRLVIETELRLLGETVNWYARRTFLGVA